MDNNLIPDQKDLDAYEKYKGLIYEMHDDSARVFVDKDGVEIEEVYPLSLFKKGLNPEKGYEIVLHCWRKKDSEIGGFIEVTGPPRRELSDEDESGLEKIFTKWEKDFSG